MLVSPIHLLLLQLLLSAAAAEFKTVQEELQEVQAAQLTKDDVRFLLKDDLPEDAEYVRIIVNSRRKIRSADQQVPNEDKEVPSEDKEVPNKDKEVPSTNEEVPRKDSIVSNTDQEVQSSNTKVPSKDKKVPSNNEEVASSEPPVPEPEDKEVPSTDNAVPNKGKEVPSKDKAVSSSDKKVPSTDKAVPSPEKEVLSIDKEVPGADKKVPSADKAVPGTDKKVPSTDKAVPGADKKVPSADKAVPGTDKKVPSTDKAVPGTDKAVLGSAPPVPEHNAVRSKSPGLQAVQTEEANSPFSAHNVDEGLMSPDNETGLDEIEDDPDDSEETGSGRFDPNGLKVNNPTESDTPDSNTVSEMEKTSKREDRNENVPSLKIKSREQEKIAGASGGEKNMTSTTKPPENKVEGNNGSGSVVSNQPKENLNSTGESERKPSQVASKVTSGKDAIVFPSGQENSAQREEIVENMDEESMKDFMMDFIRKPHSATKLSALHEEQNRLKELNSSAESEGENDGENKERTRTDSSAFDAEELNITIQDASGSMDLILRSNLELFSSKFKVVVRDNPRQETTEHNPPGADRQDGGQTGSTDTAGGSGSAEFRDEGGNGGSGSGEFGEEEGNGDNVHDGSGRRKVEDEAGEVVEVRRRGVRSGCVYVGRSEENPDVQVALTNCDGAGFTGMLMRGASTHLIRPVRRARQRTRRDDATVTEDGLHVLHATTGKQKCGISNVKAMRAPRFWVTLDDTDTQKKRKKRQAESNQSPESQNRPQKEETNRKFEEEIDFDKPSVVRIPKVEDDGDWPPKQDFKPLDQLAASEREAYIAAVEEQKERSKKHRETARVEWHDGLAMHNWKLHQRESNSSFKDTGNEDADSHHRNREPHSRGRRASEEKYQIETAVFVDDAMYDFVRAEGGDGEVIDRVQDIVYTIMNAVNILYKSPSMSVSITISLVRLDVLKSSTAGPAKASGEIEGYLNNFCAWQSRLNRRLRNEDSDHVFWDHALLLSGLDLYSETPDQDSVIGLAWVAAMCHPSYSCTINEGTSFEAVYVITHEMGHSLGMSHDGTFSDGNTCSPDKFIMSPSTGPGKVTWSNCSNTELKVFLKGEDVSFPIDCLQTKEERSPKEIDFAASGKLPGQRYSVKQQCSYALGAVFAPYRTSKSPYEDICREVWCFNRTHAMRTHPALEGTPCATSKICIGGQCVSESEADVTATEVDEASDVGDDVVTQKTTPKPRRTTTTTTTTTTTRSPRSYSLDDLLRRIRDMFGSFRSRGSLTHTDVQGVLRDLQNSTNNSQYEMLYIWVLKGFSQCDVDCGGGYVYATLECALSWKPLGGIYSPTDWDYYMNMESKLNIPRKEAEPKEDKYFRSKEALMKEYLKGKKGSKIKRDVSEAEILVGSENSSSGAPGFTGSGEEIDKDAVVFNPHDLASKPSFEKGSNISHDKPNTTSSPGLEGENKGKSDKAKIVMREDSAWGGEDDEDIPPLLVVSDELCDVSEKPPVKFVCNTRPCDVTY